MKNMNDQFDHSNAVLIDRAKFCIDWLNQHVPNLSKSSRVFGHCLKIADPNIHPDAQIHPTDVGIMNQACQDIAELSIIFDSIGDRLLNDLSHKFELLVKDKAFELDSNISTKGRDTQFELYIAAICSRAGIDFTMPEGNGPDISAKTPAYRFHIEAKRIKSIDKILKSIKKASNQLRSTQTRSVIALDITRSYNPNLLRLNRGTTKERVVEIHTELVDHLESRYFNRLPKYTSASSIGMLLIHHTIFAPSVEQGPQTTGLISYDTWEPRRIPENIGSNDTFYSEFENIFYHSLPKTMPSTQQMP